MGGGDPDELCHEARARQRGSLQLAQTKAKLLGVGWGEKLACVGTHPPEKRRAPRSDGTDKHKARSAAGSGKTDRERTTICDGSAVGYFCELTVDHAMPPDESKLSDRQGENKRGKTKEALPPLPVRWSAWLGADIRSSVVLHK